MGSIELTFSSSQHVGLSSLFAISPVPQKNVCKGHQIFAITHNRHAVLDRVPLISKAAVERTTTALPPLLQWNFRGFPVRYIAAGSSTSTRCIVLVHGFGANCLHWRRNIQPLAKAGYRVYALDLLGFGLGSKPAPGELDAKGGLVAYNFAYWSAQLREFISEVVNPKPGHPIFLGANSIGCMVTMQASADDPSICRAQAFISPSLRALNVRKRSWAQGIFARGIMSFLRQPGVGEFFLASVARPKTLRRVLESAYAAADAVDDSLVNFISQPAGTPGALAVFLAFISYDTGPIPEDFLPVLQMPCQILWGEKDRFEPFHLGQSLGNFESVKEFVPIPGTGHCAHDEAPHFVNREMLRFFEQCDRKT